MKNKFLKISSLVLSFGIVVFNLPSVSAGGGFSKPKASIFSAQQLLIISQPKYHPIYADDGGKTYFGAWNGTNEGKDFEIFAQKYSKKIQNTRPANTLKNSPKGYTWSTHSIWSNAFKIEEHEAYDQGEYILRVDHKNKIIYTIRKSDDEYLCTFYILNLKNSNDIRSEIVCYLLLPSSSNVKQLLLPIDQELINKTQ